ncbi:MAG: ATP-dependent helicase [Nitrososphaera sp.]|jgi:DNA helicase-2/ATP-dependent DNA helicase PcrA
MPGLNAEQQRAVTHQGGPLLIVAGPGSGKTRVLIERVIHLVKGGIKPSEILCLTFSEKAAEEMRVRLEKEMDASEMEISTFHAFAKDVLEDNVLDSGIGTGSGVIKKSARLVWGLKNIDAFGLQHLEIGNNAVKVIESLIDGIGVFKEELISPAELEKYVEAKLQSNLNDEERDFVNKLSDLCNVYKKYEEFQKDKAVIDFDDMVVQAISLFAKKPRVLAKYHKRFRHVLVDEFQDNNYAQLELVKMIGRSGNVTVVGDDDQSIYRFQGAYLTNFQDFREHFKDTTVVTLNQNYRSTKRIVQAAGQLLEGVQDRQKKELFSENEEGDRIVVAACSNEPAEVEFIVSRIKEMVGRPLKRRDGTESPLSYRDFVILARRKMEGRKFAKALKAYGIPTVYMGESNIFASPVVRDFMAYLQIASSPTRAGVEIYRLMKSHGITEQNIARINHAARKKAREDPTDMDFVYETLRDCSAIVTQADECKELADQLDRICALAGRPVSEFAYGVIMSATDLYRRVARDITPEGRRNQLLLKELYNISLEYESLNPQGTLADYVKYLTLMGQFDLELEEDYWSEDAVQVTTIHPSKGREFPVVFVADLAANKFPPRYREKRSMSLRTCQKG